jgi:hypothetical protein
MHHPKSFAFTGIYNINVCSAIGFASPYAIDPAGLIKTIHAWLKYFHASGIETIF